MKKQVFVLMIASVIAGAAFAQNNQNDADRMSVLKQDLSTGCQTQLSALVDLRKEILSKKLQTTVVDSSMLLQHNDMAVRSVAAGYAEIQVTLVRNSLAARSGFITQKDLEELDQKLQGEAMEYFTILKKQQGAE